MTLARFFIKLRTDAGMSQRDVGRRSKPRLDGSTLWKIENARPVRAKTLGQALRAMGLQEKDNTYLEAFSLWSTEQAQTLPREAIDLGLSRVRRSNDRAFETVVDRAATALRKMPETDWPFIIEALEHPEGLKLWVQSMRLARK